MSHPSSAAREGLTASVAQLLDRISDHFEASWKAAAAPGERPRIEDFLAEVPEPTRAVLLRELIALDLHYRRRAGEDPQAAEYGQRFPSVDVAAQLLARSSREGTAAPPQTVETQDPLWQQPETRPQQARSGWPTVPG
jgi:hypothetical protein